MGIFSGGKDADVEIKRLSTELERVEQARKRLAGALAAEQAKVAALQIEIDTNRGEVERMNIALLKTKRRQKASVERANRFKAKLGQGMTPVGQ